MTLTVVLSDMKPSIKSEKDAQQVQSSVVSTTPLGPPPGSNSHSTPLTRLDSLSDAASPFTGAPRTPSMRPTTSVLAPNPSVNPLYTSTRLAAYHPSSAPGKGIFSGHDLTYALAPGLGSSSTPQFQSTPQGLFNELVAADAQREASLKHNHVVVGVC